MTRILLAGAAALGLMSGVAMAQQRVQSESSVTTTSDAPPPGAQVTVSSGASNVEAVHPDGDQTSSSTTRSVDNAGNVTEVTITNKSYPLIDMITTTKTTKTTVNGVTKELVETTDSYPPKIGRPAIAPVTRTSERIIPDTK